MQGPEGEFQQVHPPQQQQDNFSQGYIPAPNQKGPNYLMIGGICITIGLILTASITVIVVLSDGGTSSVYNIGTSEGKQVPNFFADAHGASGWESFNLYDNLKNDQYILIQFIDTDCPHCWSDAASISDSYSQYGVNGNVTFITVASGMLATDHSRAEIVAFQGKEYFEGCYRDERNCADRPGDVHDWLYVDDNDMQIFDAYSLPGVPFHLLLDSNGIVVWNQQQHSQGDPLHELNDALNYFVG